MKTMISRRGFAGSAAAAGLLQGLGMSVLTAPASSADARLDSRSLGEGLLWIRGAGANVVAIKDPLGLVFVDGGLRPHAAAVQTLAERTLGRGRPHTLINTHWHAEHTGLNEALGKSGATIIAHEQTRLWLSTTVRYQLDAPPIRPLPKSAQPNKTTWTGGSITVGSEQLDYALLAQAHTDGDLYVKLRQANVLVTGGVVPGNGWPTPDWVTGGAITGTVTGYRTLIGQCDDATRVITAHGDRFYTRADLQAEHDIVAKLSGELSRMMRAGFGPADVLAAEPAKEYVARFGDPGTFLTESFKSLWPRLAPDA
jgi:cyclase